MVLQRWEPFRELERMQDTMQQLWRGLGSQGLDGPEAWIVPMDIVQDGDRLVLHASMPGVKPEEINVTFEDGVLTIEGQTEESFEHQQGSYLMRERRAGRFHRSVRLPDVVDVDRAETTYHNGVLTIALPKLEEKKARKLEVRTAEKALTG